jgi:competence protein ComEC
MFSFYLAFFTLSNSDSCLTPFPISRTGRETCWAQVQIDSRNKVCLSHSLWIRWLNSAQPGPICPDPLPQVKGISFLTNTSSNPLPKKARIIHYWDRLGRMPPYTGAQLKLYKFWRRIEIIRERGSQSIAPYDSFGFIRKLLFNESVAPSTLGMLRILGFVHLASATGIHLYALLAIWEEICKRFCSHFGIPIRFGMRTTQTLSAVIIVFIWLLNGARIGMLRPWMLLTIREAANLLGFRWTRASPLFIAIILDLLFASMHRFFWPDTEQLSGRWIYTLAVGGGLLWSKTFGSTHLSLAIGSWLLTALWESWEHGLLALATPFLSLITLPVTCVGAYPFLIFSLVLKEAGLEDLGQKCLQICCKIIQIILVKFSHFALFPGNLWLVPKWAILIGFIFSTSLLFVRKSFFGRSPTQVKVGSLMLFIFLRLILEFTSLSTSSLSGQKEAKQIEQLDVGQGDAALVMGHQVGLIDTGAEKALSDPAWLQLFSERRITKIDWVALTHLDEDHSGGLIRLSKLIPIRCAVTSAEELRTPRGKKFAQTLSQAGVLIQDWTSPCVPFPTLSPFPTHSDSHPRKQKKSRNQNMGAVFIPLQSGGFYLSAGDAGSKDELRIGKWARTLAKNRTSPRILKISHHGSASSSSMEFLQILQPTEAWISSGQGNRYGHPSAEVLARLFKLGLPIQRTDQKGALITKEDVHHQFLKLHL